MAPVTSPAIQRAPVRAIEPPERSATEGNAGSAGATTTSASTVGTKYPTDSSPSTLVTRYTAGVGWPVNPAWARNVMVPVEGSSVGSLVRHLSIVTGTVGQAKDELARLYLEQKRTADGTIAVLEQRLDELSKGTEGHVEPEN